MIHNIYKKYNKQKCKSPNLNPYLAVKTSDQMVLKKNLWSEVAS